MSFTQPFIPSPPTPAQLRAKIAHDRKARRDEIALEAMKSLLANPTLKGAPLFVAVAAYETADAMLAESDKA